MKKLLLVLAVCIISVSINTSAQTTSAEKATEKKDYTKMTGDEMVQKAETTLAKLRGIRKYVQNLLEQARKAKDIIKVTCLNDKLTQINVNIRTYEDRIQSLKNAIKVGDKSARDHEFKVLIVLEQRITTLRMEAETCIGEAEGYLGKTEVIVEKPTGMAELDPTTIPDIGIEIIERPQPASAFQ